ncbi:hypothetical protein [Streptomyces sp. NPDC005423]|uniref:hypothetical protein n=1 Tax=Streptomyces sp. NPDC005423 TaxID=3155343 RepID=UPI0033BD5486
MTTTAEALSERHGARARSAHLRAEAACRHAGIDPASAPPVPDSLPARAAGALRLSAGSLAALASAPAGSDPAAAARCARNAAAAAALAAQAAAGPTPTPALGTALAASRAAGAAATGVAAGRDPGLNSAAEETERLAVTAARTEGWLPPAPNAVDGAATAG